MTTPRHVDPWLAGLTHEQQQAEMRAAAEATLGETFDWDNLTQAQIQRIGDRLYGPYIERRDRSLDVDADTVLRPRGQSTWANKQQRRPKSHTVDELGYDEGGRWVPGEVS